MVVGNRGRVEGMAEGGSIGDWTTRFAGLSRLAPEIKAKLVAESRVARVPEGTVIFGPGRAPENLLLLLEGAVRVHQTSESGREIFLYRVHAGESCVLTTACLLAYEDYSAEGVAETELRAVLVPRVTFDELIARSPEFRRFVFTAYSRRITDLFLVIEEIAFRRVDVRLAQKLLQLAGPDGIACDAPESRRRARQRSRGDLAPAAGVPAPGLGRARPRGGADRRSGRAEPSRRRTELISFASVT
jgi:CRP/FNR family transcriptional regulator